MNKIFMLIFAAGTFIFASCGGEHKTEEATTTEAAPAATEAAPAATEAAPADTTKH